MTLQVILFIFFAAIAASTSVLMIIQRKAVFSALFLILNFAALAGLYLLLFAQLLAVAQVIVYAGAIMVLFLFVVMLLNPDDEKKFFAAEKKAKTFAVIIGIFVIVQLAYILLIGTPAGAGHGMSENSQLIGTAENIGREMFTKFILPFEAVAFLLVAAAIGALVLAKKKFQRD